MAPTISDTTAKKRKITSWKERSSPARVNIIFIRHARLVKSRFRTVPGWIIRSVDRGLWHWPRNTHDDERVECRLSRAARRSPHTMAASSAGCAWRATFASRPTLVIRPRLAFARAFSPRSRASRLKLSYARVPSRRAAPLPPTSLGTIAAATTPSATRSRTSSASATAAAASVNACGARTSVRFADLPAALADVTVILVGTKKAGNVGAVARACGSFECEDLRVAPRADPYTRASLSAAKGAQHIVHGAGVYDTLDDALLDVARASPSTCGATA